MIVPVVTHAVLCTFQHLHSFIEAAKLRLDKKRNRRIAKHLDDDSDKEESPVSKKKAAPPTAGLYINTFLF